MKRLGLLIISVLIMSARISHALPVMTEQQLEEKIKANKILDMYTTDAGIMGMELNQFGAPSTAFIVPGNYNEYL